jgi:succinate dehydrogenase / fumarate reductase membrane anchor subunit
VVLGTWFVGSLATLGGGSYAQVSGWLRSPLVSALTLLFVVVAAQHANLGLRVVIEDYVAAPAARFAALLAVRFALIVAAVVGVLAVLRIAFGVAA